ncbi:hypothetical protein [Guptibacillus hwajinpoensis]|uniref:hypothetical protein n=1 Tax=Guptibacillus hwajinpoensis TaxID=208199 RepID=UPI0024B326CC|nr:hypothetical protein [Pseudalkalibacillus hwajinpoensis]
MNNHLGLLFYTAIGSVGMAFVGLGIIKLAIVYDDQQGFWIGFLGLLCCAMYFRHLESQVGIHKKYRWLGNSLFIIVFGVLSVWLYL